MSITSKISLSSSLSPPYALDLKLELKFHHYDETPAMCGNCVDSYWCDISAWRLGGGVWTYVTRITSLWTHKWTFRVRGPKWHKLLNLWIQKCNFKVDGSKWHSSTSWWISSAFYSFFITNTNLQTEYVIRESCGTHRFSLTLALLLQLELESTPCLSAFVISPSGRRWSIWMDGCRNAVLEL